MYCQKCGAQLTEAGDCPTCGPGLPAPESQATQPVKRSTEPVDAIGCGMGGALIGIVVGIGLGILICLGYLKHAIEAFGGS